MIETSSMFGATYIGDPQPWTFPMTPIPHYQGTYITHCSHCGGSHYGKCPRIKAIEYHENGTIKRVEYHG